MAKRHNKHGKPRKSRRSSRKDASTARLPTLRVTRVTMPGLTQSDEDRAAMIALMASQANDSFHEVLGRIEAGVLGFEPTSLLAHLSMYFLTGPRRDQKKQRREPAYLPFHVELIQALALCHDAWDFPPAPTFPDVHGFLADVDAAHRLFTLKRMRPVTSDQERTMLLVQEQVRASTQAIRNWGYPDQVERTIEGLFGPLDDQVEVRIGVRPTALFRMFLGMIAANEQRISAHVRVIAPIARARNPDAAYAALGKAMSWIELQEIDTLREILDGVARKPSLAELKGLLLHHANLFLACDGFSFTTEELRAAYGTDVDPDVFLGVLGQLSLRFGDLRDTDLERVVLHNPVWTKPMVRLADDLWFVPNPGTFLSFGLDILERLVTADKVVNRTYLKRRSTFLESEVARLFQDAFPGARLYTGSIWKGGENDLLVVLDRVAIVLEAKSESLNDALMGGDQSIKNHVRSMLVKASRQTGRFAEHLAANPGRHRFPRQNDPTANEIDTSRVKEYLRLTVTLRQLGSVYSRWPLLQEAGLIASDEDMAPTMTLADLESVFDVLESPCAKLHYLARRAEIERNMDYVGGELDLLALYLETGFNLGQFEFGSDSFWLSGKFRDLGPYLMRHETGHHAARPRLPLSRWWAAMLRHTEDMKLPGWTRLGMALLSVPLDDQERIEREFGSVKMVVRRHWKNPGHEDLRYWDTGPPERRLAVAALAFRNEPLPDHVARVENAVAIAFERVRADRLLFIGTNAEEERHPWDELRLYLRPGGTPDGTPEAPPLKTAKERSESQVIN